MAKLGQTQYYKTNTNGITVYSTLPYGGNVPQGYTPVAQSEYAQGLQEQMANLNAIKVKQSQPGYTGQNYDQELYNRYSTEFSQLQGGQGVFGSTYQDPSFSKFDPNAPTPSEQYYTSAYRATLPPKEQERLNKLYGTSNPIVTSPSNAGKTEVNLGGGVYGYANTPPAQTPPQVAGAMATTPPAQPISSESLTPQQALANFQSGKMTGDQYNAWASNYAKQNTPATTPIGSGVPTTTTPPPLTPPTNTTDTYYTSLSQQLASVQQALDNARNEQLARIQQDKATAQAELDNIRSQEQAAITAEGTAALEEKQKKLEQLDIEQKRFDENYNKVQGLASQLTDLMTQGNALITQQKGVTGLSLIRNPRVNETINNITAQVGVIQAGISVYNGQMNQAQSQLQTATSTITSAYTDQLNYYKDLANFYESKATDTNQKLVTLTNDERNFLDAKIASLENDKARVQANSDYIQSLMISPDTALFMAQAGVTLNDSPMVVNQKLAAQTQRQQIIDTTNKYTAEGYTSVPFPQNTTGLISIQAGGKTLYFKPPEGTTTGGMEAPTIKSINGVDMQWNPATGKWDTPAGGTTATANSPFKSEVATNGRQAINGLLAIAKNHKEIFGRTAALPIPDFARSDAFRNYEAQLDYLKGNIIPAALTAMRDASKTGGALGQVSDREGAWLASSLGALSMSQDPDTVIKQLNLIDQHLATWQNAVEQYSSQTPITAPDGTQVIIID